MFRASVFRSRRSPKRWIAVLVAVLVAAAASACSVRTTPSNESTTIVVGASADPTLTMAARIYRAVLVATGTKVAPDVVIGDDAAQLTAMSEVKRDLFPAFSGRLLTTLLPASSASPTPVPTSDSDYDPTFVQLNRALPQGVSLADPTSVTLAGLLGQRATDSSAPTEQLVPVYRSAALGRDQIKTINKVAGELTADDLSKLTLQARSGDPAALAAQWVVTHGLNR